MSNDGRRSVTRGIRPKVHRGARFHWCSSIGRASRPIFDFTRRVSVRSPPLPQSSLPALYRGLAPVYDPFARFVSGAARRIALDRIGRPRGDVLVAGCGTGLSLPPLVRRLGSAGNSATTSVQAPPNRKRPTLSAIHSKAETASPFPQIEAIDASEAMLRRTFRRLSQLPGCQCIPTADLERCKQGLSDPETFGSSIGIGDEANRPVRGFRVDNVRIIGRQGDILQLPYRGARFRSVLCLYVLDLFSEAEIGRVLREIDRVLVPGGRAVVGTCAPPETPLERGWTHLVNLLPFALGGGRAIDFPALARRSRFDVERVSRTTQAGLASHITTLRRPEAA